MAYENITFEIDTLPKIIQIPDFPSFKEVNIRYPLIAPYAFAHIFWDDPNNELVYYVEEPILDDVEKEVLRLVQLALEEMINISFAHASKFNLLIKYLEKNVQSILVELGTKVSEETYKKIMYYVFRDSVGLNEIEPLLRDYFIEDIECNGVGFPIYVVHRKFENIRTNVQFNEPQRMTDFVEKIAQKTGKYISYAKPLLDGALPDGSRVNATYTEDVTTRGPTFTIRKFTAEPWTPLDLIRFETATPEVFAYLWFAIEQKFNIMVVGETASGKTTFLNAILSFIPSEARICSIEDTRELNLAHDNWMPSVSRTGFGIPNLIGKEYGEITLFDLLRETFRQNPDYVVVGEVRGREAYVLFQGMASGHPSFGTFHAGSVETLVRRLETPPINLPASLVESLDIVCIVTHVKEKEKNIRRLRELDEIQKADVTKVGKTTYTSLFQWNPVNDTISRMNVPSVVMSKIMNRTGLTLQQINDEIAIRTRILDAVSKSKDPINYKDFNRLIKEFMINRSAVISRYLGTFTVPSAVSLKPIKSESITAAKKIKSK
jgi:archaeal flagellar protein FlaI